jgi:GNAT superfamily N-acetyltransferase
MATSPLDRPGEAHFFRGSLIVPPKVALARVAEDADAYQALPSTAVRDVRPDVVLIHRPGGGAWSDLALRIRFGAADVETSIAATRTWFADHSVEEFRWLVGPSAAPSGITVMLLANGAARDKSEPNLTAMVLDHEPPPEMGVTTRRVASFADFGAMEQIRENVFGRPVGDSASLRRARWADFRATGSIAFLAELDGAPVSFGVMVPTAPGPMLLAGGVTRPNYRGRGAYRALVHARWKAAQEAGAPALVTQAQAASRPILERLGFSPTGTIEVLVDRP